MVIIGFVINEKSVGTDERLSINRGSEVNAQRVVTLLWQMIHGSMGELFAGHIIISSTRLDLVVRDARHFCDVITKQTGAVDGEIKLNRPARGAERVVLHPGDPAGLNDLHAESGNKIGQSLYVARRVHHEGRRHKDGGGGA